MHQLKDRLVAAFESVDAQQRMQEFAIESFGFKNGLPLDADIVMDVRFLPNPHWEEELRPLTGHDPKVRDYVLERGVTSSFLDRFEELLVELLPSYQGEGRSYLADRDRLHRRTASVGRDRRGDGPSVRGQGHHGAHIAPGCRQGWLTPRSDPAVTDLSFRRDGFVASDN